MPRLLTLAATLLAVAFGASACSSPDVDTTQRDPARAYPVTGPTVSVGAGPSLSNGKYRFGY